MAQFSTRWKQEMGTSTADFVAELLESDGLVSVDSLAAEWGWTRTAARRALNRLVVAGNAAARRMDSKGRPVEIGRIDARMSVTVWEPVYQANGSVTVAETTVELSRDEYEGNAGYWDRVTSPDWLQECLAAREEYVTAYWYRAESEGVEHWRKYKTKRGVSGELQPMKWVAEGAANPPCTVRQALENRLKFDMFASEEFAAWIAEVGYVHMTVHEWVQGWLTGEQLVSAHRTAFN